MGNPATSGETNERRLKLLEFAIYNDLVMTNTLGSQNRHEDGLETAEMEIIITRLLTLW